MSQLLTAAEDKRESLTVIFAGYKDDIETKLYSFNPGLKSRFKDVMFEDFTQPECMPLDPGPTARFALHGLAFWLTDPRHDAPLHAAPQ